MHLASLLSGVSYERFTLFDIYCYRGTPVDGRKKTGSFPGEGIGIPVMGTLFSVKDLRD